MIANFRDLCHECDTSIEVGQPIVRGRRGYAHQTCVEARHSDRVLYQINRAHNGGRRG